MDYKKLFYITGSIFFILASMLAGVMLAMFIGTPFID